MLRCASAAACVVLVGFKKEQHVTLQYSSQLSYVPVFYIFEKAQGVYPGRPREVGRKTKPDKRQVEVPGGQQLSYSSTSTLNRQTAQHSKAQQKEDRHNIRTAMGHFHGHAVIFFMASHWESVP